MAMRARRRAGAGGAVALGLPLRLGCVALPHPCKTCIALMMDLIYYYQQSDLDSVRTEG